MMVVIVLDEKRIKNSKNESQNANPGASPVYRIFKTMCYDEAKNLTKLIPNQIPPWGFNFQKSAKNLTKLTPNHIPTWGFNFENTAKNLTKLIPNQISP